MKGIWWIGIIVVIMVTFCLCSSSVVEKIVADPASCRGRGECKRIRLGIGYPPETVSLPTHCLNMFDDKLRKCAWLWPEGLDEFELEKYRWFALDTTKNLRDWAKNRKGFFFPHIDLTKFPHHHQPIDIVFEGTCPIPFMDFIGLGRSNGDTFGVCAISSSDTPTVFRYLGLEVGSARRL